MPAVITSRHVEVFDASKLQIILDNWEHLPIKESSRKPRIAGKLTYDPRKILEYLMSRAKFERDVGRVEVSYVHSKKADCHGRQFAREGRSLQSLSKEIRHTISGEFYNDIDMSNAHPTILLQYCKKNGLACERIEYYIQNRDACLSELANAYHMVHEQAKQIVLAVTNGGEFDYDSLRSKPAWLVAFKNQCDTIHASIMKDPAKRTLSSIIQKYKNTNIAGSVCNHVLCDIENTLLNACVKFLESKQIPTENLVLMFDGFMIPKDAVEITDELLNDLSSYVQTQTGYSMKFTQKAMDQNINLEEFCSKAAVDAPPRVAVDDNEASDLFLDDVRKMLRKSDGVIYIETENHTWTKQKDKVNDILLEKCLRANIIDGSRKPYSSLVHRAQNVIKATKCKIPDEPKFIKTMWQSTIGKLCFQDGVYDFTTRAFRPWCEVDNVFTTIIIDRPFPERDDSIIEELKKRVFKAAFDNDEKASNFLYSLSRGVAGRVKDKNFIVGLGERNSSKGVIVDLCQSAFGDYTNVIKTEYFLMDRCGNSDFAKKEGWLMDCEFTRLTFANEISVNVSDKKHALDGNIIKRFTSGGDKQTSRRLNENARDFFTQSTLFVMCNDLPPITPADATESLVMFKFPFKFVSKDDMENPLPFFRERDENLKDWVKLPNVSDSLVHLIIDAYDDHSLKMGVSVANDSLDYRIDAGDELLIFREHFIVTNVTTDYVSCKRLEAFIKDKRINMSMQKVKDRLLKMGAEYSRKTINGVTSRVYLRILLKGEDDEEEIA